MHLFKCYLKPHGPKWSWPVWAERCEKKRPLLARPIPYAVDRPIARLAVLQKGPPLCTVPLTGMARSEQAV